MTFKIGLTARMTLTGLFLLSLWALVTSVFHIPLFIFPDPFSVFKALCSQIELLFEHAQITCLEIILGYSAGTGFGILTGLLMAQFKIFRDVVRPLLLILQAIPVFVIAPLFILWCGYGVFSKILMITFLLYFTIASNLYDGLMRTPSQFLDMAKMMKLSSFRILLYIRFPMALPQLGTGLRLGAAFAPLAALVGEWVGASKGLGFLILGAYGRADMPFLFAAILMLILISLFLYHLVLWGTRKLTFWQEEQK